MVRRRVCLIGLDGANSKILDLMNLNLNITTKLRSTLPPYTPPAWTSLFTGVNPGKHGILGFFTMKQNRPSLVSASDVKYPRVFEMAAMFKKKSIVINVPLTSPFKALLGLKYMTIVSDWAAPKQSIWPYGLYKKYSEYLVKPPYEWCKYKNLKDYIKRVEEYTRLRLNLYYDLAEKDDWNLYIIVFSEIDWLLHRIPEILEKNSINLVSNVLGLIKKFILDMCNICENVIIVSDHGFEIKIVELNLNSLFAKSGLLVHKYIISPVKLRKINSICEALPRSLLSAFYRTKLGHFLLSEKIVYPKSVAFIVERGSQAIFLRDKRFLSFLIKKISELPGVRSVYRREEVYWGPQVSQLPDLIVSLQPNVQIGLEITAPIIRKIRTSGHSLIGIFAAKCEEELFTTSNVLSIYDITPTILSLLELPCPHNVDGNTLVLTHSQGRFNYLLRFRHLRRL